MIKKTKILCILDGFGLSPKSENNCAALAKMPTMRYLMQTYPMTTLRADGVDVGQENGLVGNSEVGHINIGGLKLIPQLSFQITNSAKNNYNLDKIISPDQLFDPKIFLKSILKTKKRKSIHLIGLFSKATVHSDMRHLIACIESAKDFEKIVLHIISDGRDTEKSNLVSDWQYFTDEYSGVLNPLCNKIFLGSIGGRYFGMDRDHNLDRIQKAIGSFRKMQLNLKVKYQDITKILQRITKESYEKGVFDENIAPIGFDSNIENSDVIWLFNYRTDRMKQLLQELVKINTFENLNLIILTNNDYQPEMYKAREWNTLEIIEKNPGIDGVLDKKNQTAITYFPIFKSKPVQKTLSTFISKAGKTQLHIAETEKYNHVTFFLNGGQNTKSKNEDWHLINSNKIANHAHKPEMKAKEITDHMLDHGIGFYDFIIINYANPDMLGHTGDIHAAISSMSFLDTQLARIVEKIENGAGHEMIIIADHGNIEKTGKWLDTENCRILTDTEHNPNPVPCIIVSPAGSEIITRITEKIQLINESADRFDWGENEINQIKQITTQFKVHDYKNLSSPNNWLTNENIPIPELQLWVAGVLLLGLGD